MSVNKVILIGNVGADPEVRYLDDSTPVANLSLATSETYKDKAGEKVTTTEWHRIVLWRGLATIAEKYIKKGSLIYLEGKIKTRSYEKDGQTRYTTEVYGTSLTLLGKKSDDGANNQVKQEQQKATFDNMPNNGPDDLPF